MDLEVRLPDKTEDTELNWNLFVILLAKSGNPSQKSVSEYVAKILGFFFFMSSFSFRVKLYSSHQWKCFLVLMRNEAILMYFTG